MTAAPTIASAIVGNAVATGHTHLGSDSAAVHALGTATVGAATATGMTATAEIDSHSAILTQSTDGFGPSSIGTTTNKQRAQSFQVGSAATLGSVSVFVREYQGSPTDELTIEIQTDNGLDQPSGTVLATTDAIAVRGAAAWHEFTLTAPLSLSTSTTYWIVVMRTGSLDSSNNYGWMRSGSDINAAWKTNTFTTTWGTAGTTFDYAFILYTP
jgi:hypothetical protein